MGWLTSNRLFQAEAPRERLLRTGVRADLATAAGSMAGDRRSEPTVRRVEAHLSRTERVLRIMEGRSGRAMGLLVLTDVRVFFLAAEHADPLADVPLSGIDHVAAGGTVRTGTWITLTGPGVALTVDRGLALSALQFADAVREVLAGSAPADPADPLDELVRLRELRLAGQVTEEEYQRRRSRLVREL